MKLGFVAGAFDLLHPGHIFMLTEAKSKCDRLIVGLHTDPSIDRPEKNKPIQSTFERYLQLRSLRVVEDIIPYDTEEDLLNILANTQIDIRFLGDDYRDSKSYTGYGLDIPIHFCKRKHNYSSTELRIRIVNKFYEGVKNNG
jgi:glycerol-3-phosphate cytidylyltransferase